MTILINDNNAFDGMMSESEGNVVNLFPNQVERPEYFRFIMEMEINEQANNDVFLSEIYTMVPPISLAKQITTYEDYLQFVEDKLLEMTTSYYKRLDKEMMTPRVKLLRERINKLSMYLNFLHENFPIEKVRERYKKFVETTGKNKEDFVPSKIDRTPPSKDNVIPLLKGKENDDIDQ